MTNHEHDWQPVPLACARYSCACGEEGMRLRDGLIRPLRRSSRRHVAAFEAHQATVIEPRTTGNGGWVERAPMLHEIERRRQ